MESLNWDASTLLTLPAELAQLVDDCVLEAPHPEYAADLPQENQVKYRGRNSRLKKTSRVNATKQQIDFLHCLLQRVQYPSHFRVFEFVIECFNNLDPSGSSRDLTVAQMRKKFENQRRVCAKLNPAKFKTVAAGRRKGSRFAGRDDPLTDTDLRELLGIVDVFAEFVRDPVACLPSSAAAGTTVDEASPADDSVHIKTAVLRALLSPPVVVDDSSADTRIVMAAAFETEAIFTAPACVQKDAVGIPPIELSAPETDMRRLCAFDLDIDRLQLDPVEALEGICLREAPFMTAEQVQEIASGWPEEFLGWHFQV